MKSSGALERLSEEARSKLKKREAPRSPKPMLATLSVRRFSAPDWIYERKLDGERCLAIPDGGEVREVVRERPKG